MTRDVSGIWKLREMVQLDWRAKTTQAEVQWEQEGAQQALGATGGKATWVARLEGMQETGWGDREIAVWGTS